MNAQIRKLKDEAYEYADRHTVEGDNNFNTVYVDKFAELLILECAKISEDNFHHGSAGARAMKDHFGIK